MKNAVDIIAPDATNTTLSSDKSKSSNEADAGKAIVNAAMAESAKNSKLATNPKTALNALRLTTIRLWSPTL
jgi:hypothetical protein